MDDLFGSLAAALASVVVVGGIGACSTKRADTRQSSVSEHVAGAGREAAKEADNAASARPPEPSEPALAAPLRQLDGPSFVAFDLLVNRPLSHRIAHGDVAPTLVVDPTAPDFVQYIHGNHANDWMLDVEVAERAAAAIKARKASLWVPALRPDGAQQLRMRVFNPAKWHNDLTVEVNDTPLDAVSLDKGWQTISLAIPADVDVRADNELGLSFSNLGRIDGHLSGGAIDALSLGPPVPANQDGHHNADSVTASPTGSSSSSAKPLANAGSAKSAPGEAKAGAEHSQNAQHTQDAQKTHRGASQDDPASRSTSPQLDDPSDLPLGDDAYAADAHTGLAWYVWIPEQSQLALTLETDEGCGLRAQLFVEDGRGGVRRAMASTRNLVEGRGRTQSTAIDLSKWAGQVGRLELYASKACPDTRVSVERAALVVPGQKPSVPTGVDPPKHVIFWMVDTLRADHFPLDFDTDVRAPNLVKLAKEGAHFSLAYVQGNESRTSHAALFTGQYPSRNGLVGKGILHADQYLFPEAFQDHGYRTGCHVANGYISRRGGFAQGWDYYVNNLRDGWRIDGQGLAKHGASWAKKNKDKPFFLYIGTIDPHVTYRAHDGITEAYEDSAYHGRYANYISGGELGAIAGGREVNARDKVRIENLYKSEITYNDRAFGQLRDALQQQGQWQDTMVVVTADHGDEFWEHGGVGHGHGVHQEMVHVPLLMYYPPLIPEATTVQAGVDSVDIYPTLLDAIGADRPDGLQGKSLLPLIYGANGGYPEPAVATSYLIHYGMQIQQWKLQLKRGDYDLYDRQHDPTEQRDVAAEHPLASRWLLDAMGWFRAHRKRWDKATWGVADKVKPGFLEAVGHSRR